MLYEEVTDVCSEKQTKHITTLFNVKLGGS
jgi:hypothetical protein